MNAASESATPASPERDARRLQILSALRAEADALLERNASELVDLPEHQTFGAIESTLRDLSHDFATRAHQAGIDAGKKKGMSAPASSAPTAPRTPASSVTARKPG